MEKFSSLVVQSRRRRRRGLVAGQPDTEGPLFCVWQYNVLYLLCLWKRGSALFYKRIQRTSSTHQLGLVLLCLLMNSMQLFNCANFVGNCGCIGKYIVLGGWKTVFRSSGRQPSYNVRLHSYHTKRTAHEIWISNQIGNRRYAGGFKG